MKGTLEVTQKTKKVTSQKQKRQTKSMKFKRKETSNFNDIHNIIKDLLRTLIVLMPHHLCALMNYNSSFQELMKATSIPFQQHHPS
ncbi:hypothetical protein KY284_022232 [Solanum tuberosum]|nr:hypothetical protein KY284_022232 [Solanum tuberosum]